MVLLKIVIFTGILSSIIFFFSGQSFILIWSSMELFLFFFLAGLISLSDNKVLNYQYSFKKSQIYFFVQSLGSLLILQGLVWVFNPFLITLGLVFKLGLFPFFWWLPFISPFLSWQYLFWVISMKKILPLSFLSYYMQSNFLFYLLILSSLVGVLMMGSSFFNVKILFSWSSAVDSGLMVMVAYFSLSSFGSYLIIYMLTMGCFCTFFYWFESSKFANSSFSSSSFYHWFFFLLVGLPLLSSFLYKVINLSVLSNLTLPLFNWSFMNYLVLPILILQSIFFFFFY